MPEPPVFRKQSVSLLEKPVPETWTVVPDEADAGLRVMDGELLLAAEDAECVRAAAKGERIGIWAIVWVTPTLVK